MGRIEEPYCGIGVGFCGKINDRAVNIALGLGSHANTFSFHAS